MNIPETYQPMLEVLNQINKNKLPNPMTKNEIGKLSFSKYRNNNTETMPLPASLQLLLSYDANFMLQENMPLLQPLLNNTNSITGIIRSYDLNDYLKKWFPKTTMNWNFIENAPALIPINNKGDQLIFFYISDLNNNEYPICRFDPSEFCLWISGINLFHHIGSTVEYDMTAYEAYLKTVEKSHESFFENEYLRISNDTTNLIS